ncbi:unnamed protein product [Cochlearia groenlandica]
MYNYNRPLQRQLLPEFTATAEKRETREWVNSVFPSSTAKIMAPGERELIEMTEKAKKAAHGATAMEPTEEKAETVHQEEPMRPSVRMEAANRCIRRTIPGNNESVQAVARWRTAVARSAPVEKSSSVLINAINSNAILLNGLKGKKAEAQLENKKVIFDKPNALALAGPLGFSSAPIIKNWYEETVAEDEERKKEEARNVNGPSKTFVGSHKETGLVQLPIEEIISPLKDLIEVPVTVEDPTSSEKKKKGYTAALQVRKKIVNNVARNGKMIKASRLTLKDFTSVAKTRPSKLGAEKGKISKNPSALVVGEPPVKR